MAKSDVVSPEEAAKEIFSQIEPKNYIPGGLKGDYLKGLEDAWRKAIGLPPSENTEEAVLQIEILGPGCLSCNRLEETVRNVLEENSISADITHIHDHDEIWRRGVMKTPALIINGKVLSQGRLPTRAEITEWINEHSGKV